MSTIGHDGGNFDYGDDADEAAVTAAEVLAIVAECRRGEMSVDELEATLDHLAYSTGYSDASAMVDELGVEVWVRRSVDGDEVL